jgi:CRISPR-associated protein Cas5t
MNKTLLEVQFKGWTSTPRMPFVLSGNAMCMPVPSYSTLLGLVGCCLGRPVEPEEVRIGFRYEFDSVAKDIETRQRLEYDGKKIKPHYKGSDAYPREFHINPKLTIWLDRLDWEAFFQSPIGSPALGRSQDLLKIVSIEKIEMASVKSGIVNGCMIPYDSSMQVAGQLVQLSEAYREDEIVGNGRISTASRIFLAIPHDSDSFVRRELSHPNLFQSPKMMKEGSAIYLHEWSISS